MGESIAPESAAAGGSSAAEMWMLLLVRMVTRVAEPPQELGGAAMDDANGEDALEMDYYVRQDQLRQKLWLYHG